MYISCFHKNMCMYVPLNNKNHTKPDAAGTYQKKEYTQKITKFRKNNPEKKRRSVLESNQQWPEGHLQPETDRLLVPRTYNPKATSAQGRERFNLICYSVGCPRLTNNLDGASHAP